MAARSLTPLLPPSPPLPPPLLLLLLLLPGGASAGCTLVGSVTCYADNATRLLGQDGDLAAGTPITPEYCAQICADHNRTLAGTEDGRECYCGDALNWDNPVTVPSGCQTDCTGTQGEGEAPEKCGGSWQIAVSKFTCSGEPEPLPWAPPLMVNPCLNASSSFSKLPFCNHTLPLEERVDDAVSRMTLKEKISALGTNTGAIPSLGLAAYNWWNEASSGVASGRDTKTTKFAYPITTAMSFNRTLWQVTGRMIALEARAMMNAGNGYSTFWAPVINLARDPRWGRNIETPGEDPYLSGEYATSFVKGFQEAPEDPSHLLASACCKHYVANSMDGTTEKDGEHHDRFHVDSQITMQDLVDSYMKPFQACVEKGRVSSLMCSYNAVNGVPSCANDWLLNTVARENWGFDGYITSDCDADSDVFNSHHYTSTAEEAVRVILKAGTDVDCGGFISDNAQSALNKKAITESDIDERLRMLFKVRMRLSHFDPIGPLNGIPQSVICSEESLHASHEGVKQGATLLKNIDYTLPLERSTAGIVAVIGPNAQLSKSDSGYYGPSHPCGAPDFWTLVDAAGSGGVKTVAISGVPSVSSEDQSGIPNAVKMAQEADNVILGVGTDLSLAREGSDAVNITFSSAQTALIEQVAAAAKKPVTVVIMTATPLDISDLLANPKIGAILHVGQPSVTVIGLGDILYGDVSPAGRMVQTVYPGSYQNQISIFDFNMRPGPSPFARPDCTLQDPAKCPRGSNPGRTYRFYTGKAVVPFGFGLSYSNFSYDIALQPSGAVSLAPLREMLTAMHKRGHSFLRSVEEKMAAEEASWKEGVQYAVNVTNTGSIDSDDVVLGFLIPPMAGQDGNPNKQLFGFERVHVKAGETVTVFLYPTLSDFARADANGKLQAVDGNYTVAFGIAETLAGGMGYVTAEPLMIEY